MQVSATFGSAAPVNAPVAPFLQEQQSGMAEFSQLLGELLGTAGAGNTVKPTVPDAKPQSVPAAVAAPVTPLLTNAAIVDSNTKTPLVPGAEVEPSPLGMGTLTAPPLTTQQQVDKPAVSGKHEKVNLPLDLKKKDSIKTGGTIVTLVPVLADPKLPIRLIGLPAENMKDNPVSANLLKIVGEPEPQADPKETVQITPLAFGIDLKNKAGNDGSSNSNSDKNPGMETPANPVEALEPIREKTSPSDFPEEIGRVIPPQSHSISGGVLQQFSNTAPIQAGIVNSYQSASKAQSTTLGEIPGTDTVAEAAGNSPVKTISLRIPGPNAGSVDLQLVERGGKVEVVVRTGDPVLMTEMRQDLGHLVNRLERHGYEAEAWTPLLTPVAGAQSASDSRQSGERNSSSGFGQDDSGSDPGSNGGRGSPEERRERDRQRWEEFEVTGDK